MGLESKFFIHVSLHDNHDVDINDAREEDGDGGEDAVVLEELPEGGNVPQVEGEPQVEGVRRGDRVRRPTSRYDELVCW